MSERIEINDAQLSKDLNALATTDDEAAELMIKMLRAKYFMERAEALAKAAASGTVIEREAKAKEDKAYVVAENAYLEALQAHESLKARRAGCMVRIEVWRSKNANRRAGNV